MALIYLTKAAIEYVSVVGTTGAERETRDLFDNFFLVYRKRRWVIDDPSLLVSGEGSGSHWRRALFLEQSYWGVGEWRVVLLEEAIAIHESLGLTHHLGEARKLNSPVFRRLA